MSEKKVKRILMLMVIAPFISGFLTAMMVFVKPDGLMMVGIAGMVGVWMIAAVASYKAIKGLITGS